MIFPCFNHKEIRIVGGYERHEIDENNWIEASCFF